MGDLNKIVVNPFEGDTIDLLQKMVKTLRAGKTYNPLATEQIDDKIKEIESCIWAIDESRVLDKE